MEQHAILTIESPDGTLLIDTGSPISFAKGDLMLREIQRYLELELDGLIGMDRLAKWDLSIATNQRTGKLEARLLSPNQNQEEGFSRIAMETVMGIPTILIKIQGVNRRMFLDTGADLSYLRRSLVTGSRPQGSKKDFYPMLGEFRTELYDLDLQMGGPKTSENLPRWSGQLGALPEMLELLLPSGIDGILGLDVLQHFETVLQFGTSTALFRSRPLDHPFEALCALAARDRWCWNLVCTTCGHMYFRYAFMELLANGHPQSSNWVTRQNNNRLMDQKLGNAIREIRDLPIEEQARLSQIFAGATLSKIAAKCPFPDWLGYLGVALCYTEQAEQRDKLLTRTWLPQLLDMVPEESPWKEEMQNHYTNQNFTMNWYQLEGFEREIRRKPLLSEWTEKEQ